MKNRCENDSNDFQTTKIDEEQQKCRDYIRKSQITLKSKKRVYEKDIKELNEKSSEIEKQLENLEYRYNKEKQKHENLIMTLQNTNNFIQDNPENNVSPSQIALKHDDGKYFTPKNVTKQRLTNTEKRINDTLNLIRDNTFKYEKEKAYFKKENSKLGITKEKMEMQYLKDFSQLQDFINEMNLALESLHKLEAIKEEQIHSKPPVERIKSSSLERESTYLEINQRITKPFIFSYFPRSGRRYNLQHPKVGRSLIKVNNNSNQYLPDLDKVKSHRISNLQTYISRHRP